MVIRWKALVMLVFSFRVVGISMPRHNVSARFQKRMPGLLIVLICVSSLGLFKGGSVCL